MMKKVIRILAVVLVVVLTLSLFAGCGKKDKLIGKWQTKEGGLVLTIEFKKNGDYITTYVYDGEKSSEKGQWKMTKDDKLMVREDSEGDWDGIDYEIKNNKLILNNGDENLTFKRK